MYCNICEKEREGYRMTINYDSYFICEKHHKTRYEHYQETEKEKSRKIDKIVVFE